MNKEVLDKIEQKAAKLINTFCSEMESCKDEMEYMDLIAASLVFRNLIVNHFRNNLRQDLDSEEEVNLVIDSIITVSEDISKSVILRIDSPKKEFIN